MVRFGTARQGKQRETTLASLNICIPGRPRHLLLVDGITQYYLGAHLDADGASAIIFKCNRMSQATLVCICLKNLAWAY